MSLVELRTKRNGSRPPAAVLNELEQRLRDEVRGEVHFDAGSRALYATDASNYRQTPLAVVLPRDAQDVERTLENCHRLEVPVLSRGGGTSLSGQCCNVAVVMDFTKYMRQVLQVDVRNRQVRVQPGTVLDDMKSATEPYGLSFGPDPATHNRCTLGGMLGNNSCGVHSVLSEFYGPGSRIEHHVHELDIVTYDGVRMRVGETSEAELEALISAGGRKGEIYGTLRALRNRYQDAIRKGFPDIPRRVSGYNLESLLPENGFHVARALVGTESTCVTILEATLDLSTHMPERTLLVLGYPSIYDAGDDIPTIRKFKPVGCEGIDDRLIGFMEKKGMHPDDIALLPEGGGWLLVEFGGQTVQEARSAAEDARAALEKRTNPPHMKLFTDKAQEAKVWHIRESGLGATAFVPGEPDAWPGWEDAAVEPNNVGAYLRDFRKLLEEYDLACSLYGHLAQGCIHTRIDFRLEDEKGIAHFRDFTDKAADLVVRYGGSLSGEHGDGQARADLLGKMYSPELLQAFREFKQIWDPDNNMNPGKVVEANARTDDLRLHQFQPSPVETHFTYPEDSGSFAHATKRCVGVGKCRRTSGGTMCPSYKVTLDEKHTTRGRAHLLFEMLQGETVQDGWKSEAVKESLDLCLSCKGCKDDCPVDVDIATYKSEFLSHYYKGRFRPRYAYAFGLIHRWARLGSLVPGLANFATQTPGLRSVAKAAAGIAPQRAVPKFARRTFKRSFRKRSRRGESPHGKVILWPDTFNNHFYPNTLLSAAEVLEHAGYEVVVPQAQLCCGRPLYDYGMLGLARKLWRRILTELADEITQGVPLVGVEPSCVAAFRDELPNLMGDEGLARQLSRQTLTLGEFLTQREYGFPRLERKALLHGHCQHKAIMHLDAEIAALEAMGLDFNALDSGCCGMAGSFGFEKDKYQTSVEVGEQVLLPAVRNMEPESLLIADGFSCREQVQQLTGRTALHLAEVIHFALRERAGTLSNNPHAQQVAAALF